jgi:hypothetical protein
MTTRGVLVAVAVLLLANGAILVNVARNRAGNPDAVVRLSQREVTPAWTTEKGAEPVLVLRLGWKMAPGPGADPTWFDRARLAALGVGGLPEDADSTWSRRWPETNRQAYAVLELAGPAWDRWKAQEQARQDSMQAARPPEARARHAADRPWVEGSGATASRLMAVDIGPNPSVLRQQYPDRSRYLILPALYRAEYVTPVRDTADNQVEPGRVEGRITQLLPGTLHVPRPLRDSLLGLGAAAPDSTTRYEFTMKVGRRWEAWVE